MESWRGIFNHEVYYGPLFQNPQRKSLHNARFDGPSSSVRPIGAHLVAAVRRRREQEQSF
jgi:hypothetical protein